MCSYIFIIAFLYNKNVDTPIKSDRKNVINSWMFERPEPSYILYLNDIMLPAFVRSLQNRHAHPERQHVVSK